VYSLLILPFVVLSCLAKQTSFMDKASVTASAKATILFISNLGQLIQSNIFDYKYLIQSLLLKQLVYTRHFFLPYI
jgi:hypothetical protein